MNSRITYFFRHPSAGVSIAKVSQVFVNYFKQTRRVCCYTVPYHTTGIISMFRNLLYVYRHRDREGINHLTGDYHYMVLALIGCRSVLTVHDTVMADNSQSWAKRLFFKYTYFVWPLKFVGRIVCISENTRRSLMRFTSRTDIVVIPDAIDTSIFSYSPKTFNAACPRILMIGTGWNKNVERELHALQGLSCRVTIVGKLTPAIRKAIEETKVDCENLTDLTDKEIYGLYCQSDMVLFCSLYEGFGMPILEANMAGRPVITSRIAPMPEVGGDAACYVENPRDIGQIREAIKKVTGDAAYRDNLIAKGRENAKRFLPSVIEDAYARVYDSF